MSRQRNHQKILSRRAFARAYDVSPQAVDQAVGRGDIVERPGGGIEVGRQPWELRRQTRRVSAGNAEKQLAATAKRTEAKRDLAEREEAELAADTLSAAAGRERVAALITDARARVAFARPGEEPFGTMAKAAVLADVTDVLADAWRIIGLAKPEE